jgi:hypothetical protein
LHSPWQWNLALGLWLATLLAFSLLPSMLFKLALVTRHEGWPVLEASTFLFGLAFFAFFDPLPSLFNADLKLAAVPFVTSTSTLAMSKVRYKLQAGGTALRYRLATEMICLLSGLAAIMLSAAVLFLK